jgi:hypothetical protein
MKRHPPIAGVNDTSTEAAEVQTRILGAMTASRKIGLVEDANRTARRLALAGIGLRFPRASTEQRVRLLMDLVLGDELAARVYGPRHGISER